MPQLPSNYSTPTISRAGTLISELNIIVPRAYNGFIDKYKFVPYIMMNELAGNELATDNKLFYWYESAGRHMSFVKATADVTVANSAAATITISTTGGYSAAGTRSTPEVGMIYFNSRTGVESRVTATNKTTPSAHTFTITPVVAGTNASVVAATDELQCRGFKYVGEASDYTATVVQNIDKYTNYCSQLRKDSKFTDLSLAERIDFEFEGQNYYKYKQLADDNQKWMLEKELMLLDSNLTDNLGYAESGTAGVIQQVKANGINTTYGSWGAQTTLATLERQLDAQGGPAEYDWLSDINQTIDIQNSLGNEFNNGAILYAQSGDMSNLDLARGFKSFTPYQRKYNFTRYQPFSDSAFYGGAGVGVRNNFGLLIPKNSQRQDAKTKNLIPQFCIRYQTINGQKVVISESGALSSNGKTPKMELVVSQEAHMGVQLMGANQYAIISKA